MVDIEAIKALVATTAGSAQGKALVALSAVGLYLVTGFLLQTVSAIYRFFLRPGKNLKKLGEWAIVTGATDGIGKAYAFELARQGLNVVLISRTPSKLDAVKEELQKKYPKVQVKTISIDFSQFDSDAQARVAAGIKDLNVGVLINNVGQSYNFATYFHELSDEDVKSLIELNINSTTWMTRIVLPKMLEQKKGAIVNLSSAAAKNPSPLLAEYSGAKSYIELFSQSLNVEYKKKGIHVQVQTPLFVATKLAKLRPRFPDVPTSSAYARAAVKFIGYEDTVSPYWSHALQLYIMSLLPRGVLLGVVFSMHASIRARALKKLAAKGDKGN